MKTLVLIVGVWRASEAVLDSLRRLNLMHSAIAVSAWTGSKRCGVGNVSDDVRRRFPDARVVVDAPSRADDFSRVQTALRTFRVEVQRASGIPASYLEERYRALLRDLVVPSEFAQIRGVGVLPSTRGVFGGYVARPPSTLSEWISSPRNASLFRLPDTKTELRREC